MRRRLLVGHALAAAVGLAACGGSGGGDVEAFCAAATDTDRFEAAFDQLDPMDVDGAIVTFEAARAELVELRTEAPSEVRQDIDLQVSFLDELTEGLVASDPTADERPEVYADLRPRFDEVEAAGSRLTRWVDANC